MKTYEVKIESYFKEARQQICELFENVGVTILDSSYKSITIAYDGNDLDEIIDEIKEAGIAGCNIVGYQRINLRRD